MSAKSQPYYWLECDECGIKSTEGDEFTAWADLAQAIDMAEASEWYVEDGKHLCRDHYPSADDD